MGPLMTTANAASGKMFVKIMTFAFLFSELGKAA